MSAVTEFDGREMRVSLSEPWTVDENGFLVLSRKQARDLRDHLTWQFSDDIESEDG
jgi:hypothetical protein